MDAIHRRGKEQNQKYTIETPRVRRIPQPVPPNLKLVLPVTARKAELEQVCLCVCDCGRRSLRGHKGIDT
jgi:hypothetical protein